MNIFYILYLKEFKKYICFFQGAKDTDGSTEVYEGARPLGASHPPLPWPMTVLQDEKEHERLTV